MNISLGILLIFGISVLGGVLSAFALKKLRIPQVLGYIITGVIIGESGFNMVTESDITRLAPFNFFALGIIGFLVGAEIKFSTLKKYGKQFSAILLAEGLLSFSLVGIATGSILYYVSGNVNVSMAGGIVFGAIASATDPASTLNVLQEYRAAGIVTTTVIAIVALDDALAMTLYGLGTGVAQLISGSDVSTGMILFKVLFELFGSIAIGITFGYIINYVLYKSSQHESAAAGSFALLLFCIGISQQLDTDVILATMACGILVVNKSPVRSREIFNYIKNMSIPIYILFFVLVGARLQLKSMPAWMWMLIAAYAILRSLGKYAGAWIGATITKSDPKVRQLTGLSIFAQGGVAIGLAIMASHHFSNIAINSDYQLGDVIIFGITATTFIVQIIGPPLTKLGVVLAGETGKNISRKQILEENPINGHLITDLPKIEETATLRKVFTEFSKINIDMLPVRSKDDRLLGGITINQLRETLTDQTAWDWILSADIMVPVKDILNDSASLFEASRLMEQLQTDYVAVNDNAGKFLGVITKELINKKVKQESLKAIQI